MELEIIYYFTYDDNDDYKFNLDILTEVFGQCILDNIKDDNSEGIVSIRLSEFSSDHMFDLLASYDEDEIRILRIADELIIGTNRHLNEVGL